MEVNKVVYGGEPLIDLTSDSVTEDTLLEGETAHDKSGAKITGKAVVGNGKLTVKNNGTTVGEFTANQTTDTIIDVGTNEYEKVISRGEQLVVNGNGLMGNNTNFKALSFDGAVTNNSAGSFTYPSGKSATIHTDEFFPVNPRNKYRLCVDAKTANGTSRAYSFLSFFDVDKNQINVKTHIHNSASTTTLARELKAGDTVVYLTDASGWSTSYSYGFYLTIWNYTNSYGYTYPAGTYSRNQLTLPSVNNKLDPSALNTSAKTVTLKSAYTGATVPAGTYVSQGGDGGTYKYIALSSTIVPTTWQTYTGYIGGVDTSGGNVAGKFPPAVAYCKVGFLWNQNKATDQMWVTNVTVDDVSDVDEAKSYTDQKVAGLAKVFTAVFNDTTYTEVVEASTKGYVVQAYYEGLYFPLIGIDNNAAVFLVSTPEAAMALYCPSEGSWFAETMPYVGYDEFEAHKDNDERHFTVAEKQKLATAASTSYVDEKVAGIVDSSPEALNTLNELAAALGEDPNFATTVANDIGKKVDKVTGKGLSTNDYTTEEKNKLAGIAAGAQKNTVTSVAGRTGAVTLKYSDLSGVPVSVVEEGGNDVAVIGAEYARLSNGKELVTPDDVTDQIENEAALKSEGTFFINGTGSTVGKWLGSSNRFTDYYDGLTIRYKIPVAGASTTTLNINGKGAKTVYRFGTTKLTTHFPVGSIIRLTYHESLNSGCWMCNDYDANTNTQMRVYRQTSGYNADYPLLVSRTLAKDIATAGTNDSYEAVYGVMWDDTTKVPMLNPSTGELKAVKFTGEVTKLNQRLTIDKTGNNDVAVLHAYEARMSDGARLVRGDEFDDYVEAQTPRAVIENKGFVLVEKASAPTGFTISNGTTSAGTLSLRIEEDEYDSSFCNAYAMQLDVNGNSFTAWSRTSGDPPHVNWIKQNAKYAGKYNLRFNFSQKGTISNDANRVNEVLIYVDGTLKDIHTCSIGTNFTSTAVNVAAGAEIKCVFYASIHGECTMSDDYSVTLSNICLSCEKAAQSVPNNSTLKPSYARAVIAATSTSQTVRASYYESLNATLEKFRQAIIALGGTV